MKLNKPPKESKNTKIWLAKEHIWTANGQNNSVVKDRVGSVGRWWWAKKGKMGGICNNVINNKGDKKILNSRMSHIEATTK